MTTPGRDESRGLPLTPARRGRDRDRAPAPPEATTPYDEADLQRGLAAAVLAAMGRMQLKLDAMSRQHAESTAQLQAALAAVNARLAALEPAVQPVPEPPASPYPPPVSQPPAPPASDRPSPY